MLGNYFTQVITTGPDGRTYSDGSLTRVLVDGEWVDDLYRGPGLLLLAGLAVAAYFTLRR